MTLLEGHSTHGETLAIADRMVVAPGVGTFRADQSLGIGTTVDAGSPIGFLDSPGSSLVVTSPFRGRIERILVEPGERIRAGQGIAWLLLT